jgi:hypothetical protein
MATQNPSAFSFNGDPSNPFLRAFEPKSPFAAPSDEVPADAPEGSYTYQLVQSAPAVPADDCELPVAAVEVMIRWGAAVLHVAHLTPVRSFFVGEDDGKGKKSDFFLPEEKLGARRLPLVLADGGSVRLVIPAGATGSITRAGEKARSVRDLLAAGEAEPCAQLEGAHQVALPDGARAALEINGLSFEVSAVRAGRSTCRVKLDGESLPYQGLSLVLHAGLLAATALFMPSMAMAGDEGISEQQQYELTALLQGEAVPERDQAKDAAAEAKPGEHGDVGQAGPGEAGKAGSEVSRAGNRRFGVQGEGPEAHLSRAEGLRQALDFGMIGLLNTMNGSMGSPVSPFGREIASGIDPVSGNGNMFGETIGDAAGVGGLTLTGIGEGGNGRGVDIGVGRIGTVGHDLVGGDGRAGAFVSGRHQVKSPGIVHVGQSITSGRLPPEVIQRVVRQNFGRFKACYENGLRGNPNLQGRVAVRFVIGRDGAVSSVANGGSDLPDGGVVSCVSQAFYGLSFPQPESGVVTVTYPIIFSPAS